MLGATRPHSHSMQGGATTQTGPFGSTRRERAGRAHCVVAARLQCRALPRERLLALSPPCTFVVCDKVHNRLLGVKPAQRAHVADVLEIPKRGEQRAAALGSQHRDRKSTRLNSSHLVISYAVFCYIPTSHSFPTRRSSDLLQCRALPRERLLALSPPCTFVVCDKVHNRLLGVKPAQRAHVADVLEIPKRGEQRAAALGSQH